MIAGKVKQLEGEVLFDAIVKPMMNDSAITPTRMFGSRGLKVNGKVFVILVKGKLVVKLPKARVDTLIAEKKGSSFSHIFAPARWRPMKEWVAIAQSTQRELMSLIKEAHEFVSSS